MFSWEPILPGLVSLLIGYKTFIFSHHLSEEPLPRSQEECELPRAFLETPPQTLKYMKEAHSACLFPLLKLYTCVLHLEGSSSSRVR